MLFFSVNLLAGIVACTARYELMNKLVLDVFYIDEFRI